MSVHIRFVGYLAILALSLCAGCGAGDAPATASGAASGGSRAAIEEAIDQHLARRSDLEISAMKVSVEDVKFAGDDEAEARVKFVAGADASATMEMNYKLLLSEGVWQVQAPQSGGGPHGIAVDPPSESGGELPSNHPPVGEPTPKLPQGHLPVQQ